MDESRYYPSDLWHVYIKLDFEEKYEKATTKQDAKSFLSSVGKAAYIAESVSQTYEGMVLEVQGSMLHVVLPSKEDARSFSADLHAEFLRPWIQTGSAPLLVSC